MTGDREASFGHLPVMSNKADGVSFLHNHSSTKGNEGKTTALTAVNTGIRTIMHCWKEEHQRQVLYLPVCKFQSSKLAAAPC